MKRWLRQLLCRHTNLKHVGGGWCGTRQWLKLECQACGKIKYKDMTP